jgi:hypothetical protein
MLLLAIETVYDMKLVVEKKKGVQTGDQLASLAVLQMKNNHIVSPQTKRETCTVLSST